MNILMVTMQMDIGGAETHILELCRALAKMGHHITLVSNGGVYADMLAADGVEHVSLPLHTKKPAAVGKGWQGLEDCIHNGNRYGHYDIVHAHARIPAWICGRIWDKYRKQPLVQGGKEVPLFRFVTTAHLNFSLNPLWRRISRWGERTMSVSEDIVDYLVTEYGCNRERIQTTINGIDMVKFSPDTDFSPLLTEFGLDKSHRRLVYMSRLDADRAGYAYTIARIAPRLAEKYPELDILIVGGGTEEEKIRKIAEESNRTAGRTVVTMTGNRSDTNRFCAAADVFVGVSRSALEAMAAACPVIVAGNQGVLGIFDETKRQAAMDTNFCCRGCGDYTDDQLLSDICTMLDKTPNERQEMGRYCREIIRQYYTADRMAADYEDLYRKVLASPVVSGEACDVLLSGYYGFGNMGDESLLSVIAASLNEACPGVRITALTKNPHADQFRTGLHCISRTSPGQIWRTMGKSKLFLSGGGSLLQDATSGKSLRYYAALLKLAGKRGMKTCLYANGIGPIRREKNRILTGRVVSGCTMVSVRDPDSQKELISMGVPADKIKLSADPAFLLTPPPDDKARRIRSRLGAGDLSAGGYVVLSLRRLGKKQNAAGDTRLITEIARFCDLLYRETALIPVLIPMQSRNDDPICLGVMEKAVSPVRLVRPVSAEEMLAVTAQARLAVGMRLHCLIYAATAGIPVVGLSYDPKIDALMGCLGQKWVYDAAAVSADVLLTGVQEILATEAVVRDTLGHAVTQMRERCMADVAAVCEVLRG